MDNNQKAASGIVVLKGLSKESANGLCGIIVGHTSSGRLDVRGLHRPGDSASLRRSNESPPAALAVRPVNASPPADTSAALGALFAILALEKDSKALLACLVRLAESVKRRQDWPALSQQLRPFHLTRVLNRLVPGSPEVVALLAGAFLSEREPDPELRRTLTNPYLVGTMEKALGNRFAEFEGCPDPEHRLRVTQNFMRSVHPLGIYTLDHSLAGASSMTKKSSGHRIGMVAVDLKNPPNMCYVVGKHMFVKKEKAMTKMTLMVNMSQQPYDRRAGEAMGEVDWEELARLSGAEREVEVKQWQKSHKLYMKSFTGGSAAKERVLLESAVALSDYTTDAQLRLAEMNHQEAYVGCRKGHPEDGLDAFVRFEAALKDAERGGVKAMEMTNAFAEHSGELYNWLPGRGLLRVLMYRAFVIEHPYPVGTQAGAEALEEVDLIYKRILGLDRADHLGARLRLMGLLINRGHEIGTKEVKHLLRGKYGEDDTRDDIFASSNFNRSLHTFIEAGKATEKADRLLEKAILINAFVAPFLLGWEPYLSGQPAIIFWGGMAEANEYCLNYAKHWNEKSLEWLERIFCLTCLESAPGDENAPLARLEMKATRLRTQGKFHEAIAQATAAMETCQNGGAGWVRCTYFRALCHFDLEVMPEVIVDLSSVLKFQPCHRKARFMRADVRGIVHDYEGAKEDLHFILEHIDPSAVKAVEDLTRIYAREGRSWKNPATAVEDEKINRFVKEAKASRSSLESSSGLRELGRLIPDHVAPPAVNLECEHCKRQRTKLHMCSGCRAVWYCSPECQKQDWKDHRPVCKAAKAKLAPLKS